MNLSSYEQEETGFKYKKGLIGFAALALVAGTACLYGQQSGAVEQQNMPELQNLFGYDWKQQCFIDEAQNALGPNRCSHSNQCAGQRYCSAAGWCNGLSHCPKKKNFCKLDEGANLMGPNRCKHDNECAGKRKCSHAGWCMGKSGCKKNKTPVNRKCFIDESKNKRGPNRCWSSNECFGARTCSAAGWCMGNGGHCPKTYKTTWRHGNSCKHNEATNKLGSNKCAFDWECAGKRTCSHAGWCQGKSFC